MTTVSQTLEKIPKAVAEDAGDYLFPTLTQLAQQEAEACEQCRAIHTKPRCGPEGSSLDKPSVSDPEPRHSTRGSLSPTGRLSLLQATELSDHL